MFKNIEFKITIIAKVLQIILFKIALTEGMPFSYYVNQRITSCILFIIIIFTAGKANKYFSYLLAVTGALIFNPIHKSGFSGETYNFVEWTLIGLIMLWIYWDLYNFYHIPTKGKAIFRALKARKISGMYEIKEATILYQISNSLMDNLKEYMKQSQMGTMSSWYYKLTPEEKIKVIRLNRRGESLEEKEKAD